jgi:ATP-dependent Lon protease
MKGKVDRAYMFPITVKERQWFGSIAGYNFQTHSIQELVGESTRRKVQFFCNCKQIQKYKRQCYSVLGFGRAFITKVNEEQACKYCRYTAFASSKYTETLSHKTIKEIDDEANEKIRLQKKATQDHIRYCEEKAKKDQEALDQAKQFLRDKLEYLEKRWNEIRGKER